MRLVLMCVAFCVASAATAQDYSYAVNRGETIRVFSWSFFDDSCKKTKLPEVRATKAPKLGSLTKGTAPLEIRWVVDDTQKHCIGRSAEGVVVNYTAGQTAGTDTFTLSRKRLGGRNASYDIQVTVR